MSQAVNAQQRVANGTRRLAEAVRAAKIASAQRTDVVVDIREADRARLEMFAEELQPIIDAVPGDDDLFDFTLAGGPQPRFWIDGTAHVSMARDRRTYRLSRETRLGRVTLAEAGEARLMADRVTDYVAERMVEREKAYALGDGMAERLAAREEGRRMPQTTDMPRLAGRPVARVPVAWLLVGILVGAASFAIVVALGGSALL